MPLELLLAIGAGLAASASAVLFINDVGGVHQAIQAGQMGIALGPVLAIAGVALILSNLWKQLRGIRMTPESIT